jgi:excisionase family DNA binding protein
MSAEPEETALYHVHGIADLLLYIGISKDFGQRWKAEAREYPWWGEKRWMTVRWYGSRPEAAAAEDAAISAEDPKYNKRRPPVPEITPCRPAPGPPPSALTYREAALKLGVSLSMIYTLLRNKEICSVELGPQVKRIHLSELEAYVARKKAEQWAANPGIAA